MSLARLQIKRRLVTLCLAIGTAAIAVIAGPSYSGAKPAMFNDLTYEELKPYAQDDRLIAVLRCEAIEILSPGSRRERQQIRGSLLAGPSSMPPGSSLLLSRHAQGKPLMEVGKAYLIAAYRESATGPWALVEHRLVESNAALSEYETARDDVKRRLDTGQPR